MSVRATWSSYTWLEIGKRHLHVAKVGCTSINQLPAHTFWLSDDLVASFEDIQSSQEAQHDGAFSCTLFITAEPMKSVAHSNRLPSCCSRKNLL